MFVRGSAGAEIVSDNVDQDYGAEDIPARI